MLGGWWARGPLTHLLWAVLVLLVAGLEHSRRQALHKGLLGAWQDDLRDNVLNYDEQGGGEEDQVRPVGLPWGQFLSPPLSYGVMMAVHPFSAHRTPTISPSCVTPISLAPRLPGGSPFGGGMPPIAVPCTSIPSDARPTSRTSSTR